MVGRRFVLAVRYSDDGRRRRRIVNGDGLLVVLQLRWRLLLLMRLRLLRLRLVAVVMMVMLRQLLLLLMVTVLRVMRFDARVVVRLLVGTRWHHDRRISGTVNGRDIIVGHSATVAAAAAASATPAIVVVMMVMVLVVMVAGRNGSCRSGRIELLLLLLVAGRDLGGHGAVGVRSGRIVVGVQLLLLLGVRRLLLLLLLV